MVVTSLRCVSFLVNFDGSLNEISGLLCHPVLICNLKDVSLGASELFI